MTSRALVGPLPTIAFHDGTRQAYTVPRDTLDPRYVACREHRSACDCREGEHAEILAEYRFTLSAIKASAQEILSGHRLYDYDDDATHIRLVRPGDGPLACQCTGCRLVRRADAFQVHTDIHTGIVL